jgi:hypothetical protein
VDDGASSAGRSRSGRRARVDDGASWAGRSRSGRRAEDPCSAGILGGVELSLFPSLVLVLAGLWNLLIWPRFFQRIAKDPRSRDAAGRPTRFLRVHAVLIGVSVLFALAVGAIGVVFLALAVDSAT